MQTSISLCLYFSIDLFFMSVKNVIVCTVDVDYTYLTEFTRSNKVNLFIFLLAQATRLRSFIEVRDGFQPSFAP